MKSSSDLISKSNTIFFYDTFNFLFHQPSLEDIERAALQLRSVSTYMDKLYYTQSDSSDIEKRVKLIRKLLDLKPLDDID